MSRPALKACPRASRLVLALSGLLATLGSPGAGHAQGSVIEPLTKLAFPAQQRFDGVDQVLVGVGARRPVRFLTIYGAGLYAEPIKGRQVWRRYLQQRFVPFVVDGALDLGRLRRSAALRHFMIYGRFPKSLVIRFVRPATVAQCDREYRTSLVRQLRDPEAPEVRDDLQRFLTDVSTPMAVGDSTQFRSVGDHLIITSPDGRVRRLRNLQLVHALWAMYFGGQPVQADLGQQLLSRIEAIAEP